jgi:hypothetical protein
VVLSLTIVGLSPEIELSIPQSDFRQILCETKSGEKSDESFILKTRLFCLRSRNGLDSIFGGKKFLSKFEIPTPTWLMGDL